MPRAAIASGKRDKWVTIQQMPAEDAAEGSGVPSEVWTDLVSLWMSKHDQRADERFVAHQESAYYETQWGMPYRPDMDPDLLNVPKLRRLLCEGRVHNIRAASQIGRRDGIELITLAS